MNFLKAIGDHMNGSGLADVWGEMGLLGPGAVDLVLTGKAYNKAMRAHKLASPDAKPPLICCRGGRGLSCLSFKDGC